MGGRSCIVPSSQVLMFTWIVSPKMLLHYSKNKTIWFTLDVVERALIVQLSKPGRCKLTPMTQRVSEKFINYFSK